MNKHTINSSFWKSLKSIFFSLLCAAADGSSHLYTGLRTDVMQAGKDVWVKYHSTCHSLLSIRTCLERPCVHCLFSLCTSKSLSVSSKTPHWVVKKQQSKRPLTLYFPHWTAWLSKPLLTWQHCGTRPPQGLSSSSRLHTRGSESGHSAPDVAPQVPNRGEQITSTNPLVAFLLLLYGLWLTAHYLCNGYRSLLI